MNTTPIPPKPVEKIAVKDVKVTWSDIFEVKKEGNSQGIKELRAKVIEALEHYQNHRFINSKTGMVVDGQQQMQEVAQYLHNIKANPGTYKTALRDGEMQNGKFVIEVHERAHDKNITNGITVYCYGNETTGKEHPIKSYIGLEALKKDKTVVDAKGNLHREGLEALIAYQLSHFANTEKSNALGLETWKTVLGASMEQYDYEAKQGHSVEPKAKPADKKPKPPAHPSQPAKSSQGKVMMGSLVSPDEFQNFASGENKLPQVINSVPVKSIVTR